LPKKCLSCRYQRTGFDVPDQTAVHRQIEGHGVLHGKRRAAQQPCFGRQAEYAWHLGDAGNRRHERWGRAVTEHDQIVIALEERNGALLRAHHRNGWRVARDLVAGKRGEGES